MAESTAGTLAVSESCHGFDAVTNPYTGETIGSVALTVESDVRAVIQRAHRGRKVSGAMSRAVRAEVLDGAARIIEERSESYARLIVAEAGKTIVQARKEVLRAVNTLSLSAAEARRNAGEIVPFDSFAGSEFRQGWFTREPLGIIAAITPYNDPLNLVAHKLGPAIAGGNAIILKPSRLTPLSALRLVDALVEAGLPQETITVVNCGRAVASEIIASRDIRMVSFTGGFASGEAIARSAGLKKLSMDLGGNAPVLVLEDANLEAAVEACVSGSFWAAGQNCIGTQRILVSREVYVAFRDAFVAQTMLLTVGDPGDEGTDVGPMITAEAACAAKRKVDAAIAQGGTLLCGNKIAGNLYWPTVLENVSAECSLWQDEAFAPVVVLQPFDSFDEALERANEIDFSLHAGVFTTSLDRALEAARRLDAAGIMVNDSSDYRFDGMPFGGFKHGSMGREGVRFAYEEMTQPKVVCISRAERP